MRDLGKVIAHIPARAGSKRVKSKNLRLLCGKPLLSYSVNCALETKVFDDIYVNSDSAEMLYLAASLGVKTYKRDDVLANDHATGDLFTIDFIKTIQPDTLVMINPVCPLITSGDVKSAIEAFKESGCDTLISCETTQMQTFCNNQPINISLNGHLRPTQENPEVEILNWAVTIWDAHKFVENYNETGSAYIGKNRLLYSIDRIHGIKISTESDFRLAECIMHGRNHNEYKSQKISYWQELVTE